MNHDDQRDMTDLEPISPSTGPFPDVPVDPLFERPFPEQDPYGVLRNADYRRFLLGDGFTAADLTFAALAAPMLLPSGYGSPLPPPDAMPPVMAQEVYRLRAHPAGQFADRLYAEERVRPAGQFAH